MFPIKYNIVYFIVFNIIVQIQSLVELPPVEDNEIAITESALRRTVNSLFSTLKLKRGKHKERIREFSTIHNFFVSITLQDDDNLKEIAKLAKVDYIDNNTQHFITQLNEVLNEDNKSNEALDDVYVNTHVETFLKRLEYLKHMHGFRNNISRVDINAEIIKHLNTDPTDLENDTKGIKKLNYSDGNQSDDEFWKPSGRRIYQGRRTKIKRFPFMASVQFFKKFQCGGSIIAADLVITSASCLQLAWNNRFFRENPSFLSVQVGSDFYEGGDENIAVQEVNFHPEYNPKNLNNNLAVMRLTRVLRFRRRTKRVRKIEIDRNPWKLPETTAGITIVGWGARNGHNFPNDPWSNRLSFAVLDFYSLSECQEVYSKDYVTNRNFCAGFVSKGGGACNRDVGGPGVASGVLVGVVSFGSPNCGTPDAPTVFTKVGYYANWIDHIMEQHIPNAVAATTVRPLKRTYAFDFESLSSTPSYKVTPISDDGRTDDADLFKEFIRTVFDSEEMMDYLDQNETEIEKPKVVQETTKKEPPTKKYIRTIVKPTTQSIPEYIPETKEETLINSDDETSKEEPTKSVKMVTSLDKFDGFDSNHEKLAISDEPLAYTVKNAREDDRKETKESIAKLIDDIVKELIQSQISNEDTTTKVVTPSVTTAKPVDVDSSDETYYSSSEEDYSEIVEVGKKEVDKKGEINAGLSIPIETFEDLTFRQNDTGILHFLSKADLLALVAARQTASTPNIVSKRVKKRIHFRQKLTPQSLIKRGFRYGFI